MNDESTTLQFKQEVQANPADIYEAFTIATLLREWLCDVATTDPRMGGRMYMAWNNGFYASGEFTSLEPNKLIAFTWNGRGEPAPTQVTVALEKSGTHTIVTLTHSGLGAGSEWESHRKEFQSEWVKSLENLASVWKTGEDLRLTMRPMLGIIVSDFNAQIAEQMGCPVSEGIRMDSTIDGMGARAAGLDKDDVVTAMDGKPVTNFPSLTAALGGKRAGDVVEVVYYRGPEKRTTQMKLSKRPLPDIPWTANELASVVKANYDRAFKELSNCLEGVTEAEASHAPGEGEWSVKEVLSHLIQGERDQQLFFGDLIGKHVPVADNFAGNSHPRTRALVKVYPTLPELMDILRKSIDETIAFVADFPAEFIQRKPSYWSLAYGLVQPQFHIPAHMTQINAALESARKQ